MKRFNHSDIQTHDGESNTRPIQTRKSAQWHYTAAGAAIFVIIILHFVSQFIFFQSEKASQELEAVNHRSVEIQPEIEQSVRIETEATAQKPEVVSIPNDAPVPIVQPQSKPAPPSRAVIKKKEQPRQSRAERLRRAEKILTGV